MENLLGVILCGGESKRMGTDKGLRSIGNTIWAKHVANKLHALHIPIIYSVNQQQVNTYGEHIDAS